MHCFRCTVFDGVFLFSFDCSFLGVDSIVCFSTDEGANAGRQESEEQVKKINRFSVSILSSFPKSIG
jgi:hypothetical protein